MSSRLALFVATLLFAGTVVNAQDSAEKEVRKAMDDNFAAIIHKDSAALNRQWKTPTEQVSRQAVVWLKQDWLWKKHVLQITSTTPIPESAYSH
jgi:archaellum component FlaG (FlaF/FlaG flagellin family)